MGTGGATAHRCVDDVNPLWREFFGELHRCRVTDGGVDGDDGAGLDLGREFSDHLTYLCVVQHGDADEVGIRDIGQVVRRTRAGLDKRRHGLGPQIEDRQAAGPVDKPLGHGRTHVAQTDVPE